MMTSYSNYDNLYYDSCLTTNLRYYYCYYYYQGCARGPFGRDRGETKTLKPETDAKTEALTIQAEARPRPRPSELETVPRDGLQTEVSRPRPHS